MKRSIGENIKRERKARGLTQKQLGELLGVSPQMIGQYETGVRIPRYSTIKRIANALGTHETLIIDYSYERETNSTRIEDNMLFHWLDSMGYTVGEIGSELEDAAVLQFVKKITKIGSCMNEKGMQAAIDHAEELSQIPAYQKESKGK